MRTKSVKFNFIMNFILTISQFLFPLITFPYVSRVLGPSGNGSIAFATSVVTYFIMFTMLGVPTYGIRACAKVRDNKEELSKVVQELMIINFVMMLICYLIFGIALLTVDKFQEDKILLVISSVAIFLNVIGVSWLYSALEQYAYITTMSLVFKVISVVLMFAFVHSEEDYILYGTISVIASGGSFITNFVRMRKFVSFKPVGQYDFKRHMKPICIFFAMSIATTIYTNLDTVMLGFMQTNADVGFYNAAVKIKAILVSLVTSLGTVLLPRLSFYIENGLEKEFRRMIAKALNFVLLVAFPLTVYFMLYAKESILLLSGEAYLGAVIPMCVITPTIILIGITNVLGIQVLVPIGKENQVLLSVVIGALVDLVLNVIFIPRYAATGAALGTLVAEIAVLIVQLICLRLFLIEIKSEIQWKKVGIALLISTVAIIFGKMYVKIQSDFISLAVSSILYFGLYGVVLLLLKDSFVLEIVMPIYEKIRKRKG